MTSTPSQGLADPDRRLILRAAGALLVLTGLLLVGVALADLAGAFDRTIDVVDVEGLPGWVAVDNGPGLFWLVFLGIPLLLGGAAALLAGYAEDAPRTTVDPGTCSTCGRRNEPGATFCDTCGTRLLPVR